MDEYEPEQGKSPRKSKQSKEFLESVAELKDPTKHVLADSELLLSDSRAMIREVQRRMDSYRQPHYEDAISSLSQLEITELKSLADSCCEMMQDFVRQVKEGKWRQPD